MFNVVRQVNVDVRAPQAGTIVERYAEEGAEVNVGEGLFKLAPLPEGAAAPATAAPAKEATAASATPAPAATSKPAAKLTASNTASAPPAGKVPPSPAAAVADRSETRVKMTRMRLRIAQRLKEAQNTAAMLTTFQEVDMHNLIEMRKKYKDDFEKTHGVKLGFMSAFVTVRNVTPH